MTETVVLSVVSVSVYRIITLVNQRVTTPVTHVRVEFPADRNPLRTLLYPDGPVAIEFDITGRSHMDICLDFARWKGGAFAQDCFHYLDPDTRELLLNGVVDEDDNNPDVPDF